MKYKRVCEGKFLERPNRFIAKVEIDGQEETVHVKNTGRCKEILREGATVYLQESEQADRKTKWDLIAVKKNCQEKPFERIINIDSQAPNQVVKEWLEDGKLFGNLSKIQPECSYGDSRFDFYVEAGERKIFIEVKGVSLEEERRVSFPDAPSDRAVKHLNELIQAKKEGYEAYVIFVIQMEDVDYLVPNADNHLEFAETLLKASKAGVKVLAYDCMVTPEELKMRSEVPVLVDPKEIEAAYNLQVLQKIPEDLVKWFRENKRDLPWRQSPSAYQVWVSEIMLQQTRVEAVKPYYERFLKALPDVKDLAEAKEDQLLKLWEGLGYYNRVRNMQEAAKQIVVDYQGEFPSEYQDIRGLKGIGSYTAGAISSIAFGQPHPAVDGNVLRVVSRLTGSWQDIMKQSVRTAMEETIAKVIPADATSDFNQGLIELGAIVCVPNGAPKCDECPLQSYCRARRDGIEQELPVKKKAAKRRIEERTVLVIRDGETCGIRKRDNKGLLAGLYELPNLEGHLSPEEVLAYCKDLGLATLRIKSAGKAKHIFSHVEWHMIGYQIMVDELEKSCPKDFIFAHLTDIKKRYPIPAAFEHYMKYLITK